MIICVCFACPPPAVRVLPINQTAGFQISISDRSEFSIGGEDSEFPQNASIAACGRLPCKQSLREPGFSQ